MVTQMFNLSCVLVFNTFLLNIGSVANMTNTSDKAVDQMTQTLPVEQCKVIYVASSGLKRLTLSFHIQWC